MRLSIVRKGKFSEIVTDPAEAAEEAGLRYVSDTTPGYTRKRHGESFRYFDTDGKLIRDEPRSLRIGRLAIPPAYHDVWICPLPNGMFKLPDAMIAAESSIGIMSAGGPFAMRINMTAF
jgi:DNA topoisomerase IB